ncbi:NTP transferase domain-containing protein [Leeuwenhoekiella sp. NPDC079379]|uniref:nucleotidyltransferase family protein n=1 Tax=Leeuwenhoekiella sp. NPDC079379 TaxID=3364122 RepID=UPI0037C65AD5
MKSTAILILAAGSASRMGKAKQLLPYKTSTLLGHAIKQALASKAKAVYCVIGANAEVIENSITQKIHLLYNSDWRHGLGNSIATGIKHITDTHFDCVLVMLADQPKIDTDYLNQLINTAEIHENKCIASGYGIKNGVPAVFPRSYFKVLEELSGDLGARELLNAGSDFVVSIDAKNKIQDIDTPEDYRRLLKK